MLIDITGNRYGKLVVIKRVDSKPNTTYWLCKCDCGKEKIILGNSLKSGATVSCGCYQKSFIGNLRKTHGDTGTKLYTAWNNMKARCYRKITREYDNYGGRGIAVCDEWIHSYETFKEWALNNGYSDGLTLDRINVDGNYCPENCRWITNKEQQNNKRNNVLYTYNGETKTLAEWAESLGICYKTLQKRIIKLGVDKAFSTPLLKERIIDLTGQKFGRLYVESLLDTKHGDRFECICDCGNKTIQRGYDLRKGNVVSCGCYQRENASKNMRKLVLNEQT